MGRPLGASTRAAAPTWAHGPSSATRRARSTLADVVVAPVKVTSIAVGDTVGLARVRTLRQEVAEMGRRADAQCISRPLPSGCAVAKVAVDVLVDVLGVAGVATGQSVVPSQRVLPLVAPTPRVVKLPLEAGLTMVRT